MSEVMKTRLNDVCPVEKVVVMSDDELLKAVNVAFDIIGYNPINLDEAISYVNNNINVEWLSEYVYEVWEADQ